MVIEAAHKAGIIIDDPNAMSIDGGFLVRSLSGDDTSLKKLKIGNHLYPYIDDVGDISQTAAVFRHDPSGDEATNLSHFRNAAETVFALETRRTLFGKVNQQETHRNSMRLKGSRILPSYLEIKKIQLDTSDIGTGKPLSYAFVSGRLHRMHDPRLMFSSLDEETSSGKGKFNPRHVKIQPNGNFLHLVLSPYAKQIESLVDEQKEAFNQYSTLYSSPTADPDDKAVFVSKYEHTRKLLKPHANEIYKYQDGIIYYINSGGNWQTENVAGLRDLDIDDRHRIYQYLKSKGKTDSDLKDERQAISSKSLHDQGKLATLAAALQPHVMEMAKQDLDDLDRRKKKLDTLTPLDGPLGVNDLPGLKKGVTLFPHQSMLLASLKDRNRMLVDADPGAGKALIIICDILQQMKLHRIQRPLVLMPESLLAQFAKEVREFSELNPWIISTDSIHRWSQNDSLPEFLADARRSPRNTVFLTSYTWISLNPDVVPNGEISKTEGKIKSSKVFNKPRLLMERLKIDAVYEDECHVLKGASNMAKAAASFAEVPIFRGLTGTVMPGNPYDVTGPMSSIHSSVFGTSDDFIRDHTVGGSIHNYQKDAPKQIRQRLRDFGCVSVRKSAWSHLLPRVHREFHFADFTPDQRKAYTALLANILDEIRQDPKLSVILKRIEDSLAVGDEITAGPLLSRFIPLDVFLNAPSEAKDWLHALMTGDNAVSPKAKTIDDIIHRHLANPDNGKVLVFVQYREAAKNLLDNLSPDIRQQADYYEGGMADVLNRFKSPQDPLKILFGVDKSLMTGHNIQSANCIIHADLRWLPGDLAQRESRAVRIGQKRDVYIHTVLVKGAAEILKQARLISLEHMIAKANSDFTDNHVIQPIQMTLSNMQTFNEEKQLHPYLERKKAIESHIEKESVKAKDMYGPTMMRPHGYSELGKVFKDAKILKKLPSSKDFTGNLRDSEELTSQDLDTLPADPKHPKLLTLDLMQWDDAWYLFSYKSADPNGFLRQLGFSLMRGYYYLEVASKASVDNIIKKLEKNLVITNKPEFEMAVRESRVTSPGSRAGLRKMSQKAKQSSIAAETEVKDDADFVDKSKKGEISLEFSVMAGSPVIWTHNVLTSDDPELAVLKRIGFDIEPPFWKKQMTRSQLRLFFHKLMTSYPNVRIANWQDFKSLAHLVFKGLDLTEFDGLAEKTK